MISIERIGIIILILIFIFFLIKFLKELFSKPKKKFKKKPSKRKKVFLTAKTKAKADRKYGKLLAEFKRKHKRKPSKDDLFRVVIAASHHTFPVKGRNVRRWTKGKRGHWNRQKVRKYLLEKHNIVKNYKMK
jgi:hypothetical protein